MGVEVLACERVRGRKALAVDEEGEGRGLECRRGEAMVDFNGVDSEDPGSGLLKRSSKLFIGLWIQV